MEDYNAQQDATAREGGANQEHSGEKSNDTPKQHTPRPRFTRQTPEAVDYHSDRGYTPRPSNYRQSNERPAYNRNNDYDRQGGEYDRIGGYQRRESGSWQGEGQGGYTPRSSRPAYDREEGYGYPRREGGYQRQDGGYQRREGGYQRREGGYQRQEGGYQRREGGYQRQEGGYQRQGGGYQRQEGGYQRQGGGYQRQGSGYQRQGGGYQRQGGGYQRQEGGYQRQGGGYQQPRYNPKRRVDYKEDYIDPTVPIRLNKFLANAGVCSRRNADKYIEAGEVKVNGEVITSLGTRVLRTDEVLFRDAPVRTEKKVYVLLNKPKGYVTTTEEPQERHTVMELVRTACRERIYPVGRLDKNTTGVLLLTNDGELASKLTHPKFLKKKIYYVGLDKDLSPEDMQKIATGITLDDGEVKADEIAYTKEDDRRHVGIEIHSGRNRIVRRIFETLGYHVVHLDRVYFAGLTKKHLTRGDWRHLTEKEVSMLRMGAFD